jgi:hypothetical protein
MLKKWERQRLTPAVRVWRTIQEWSYDPRTGAYAYASERLRRPKDPPGKNTDVVWEWRVVTKSKILAEGVAQNQDLMRRAVRKAVRALPDKEST